MKPSEFEILVACEESQKVTSAFIERGFSRTVSCDLLPTRGKHPDNHHQGDLLEVLNSRRWDLVIGFPPCTYLCNSGVGHLIRMDKGQLMPAGWVLVDDKYINTDRWDRMLDAVLFYRMIRNANAKHIVIENPVMHLHARCRLERDKRQFIQPYHFGHLETKLTGLEIINLPPLRHTSNLKAETMALPTAARMRIHYCSPGPFRARIRSETYQGIADALAQQYGDFLRGVNREKRQ